MDKNITYLLTDDRAYKIGTTTNLQNRIDTHRGSNPYVRLLCSSTAISEAFLLSLFADKRISGEWFDLAPDEVHRASDLIAGATPDEIAWVITHYIGSRSEMAFEKAYRVLSENLGVPPEQLRLYEPEINAAIVARRTTGVIHATEKFLFDYCPLKGRHDFSERDAVRLFNWYRVGSYDALEWLKQRNERGWTETNKLKAAKRDASDLALVLRYVENGQITATREEYISAVLQHGIDAPHILFSMNK